ncbi:MAG: S1 RNA-binding domain-containing protein, partial [Pseudolabrys sp.]|nr:S1 RNA-binding domain-containing protein [Pseudolabrys sp.]
MANKMLIDATHPEETRVVVLRGNRVEEFDFESANRKQLRGNIYLAKVTRVEPSLQAAFVDYGGNRHGFLAFSEIHPDYYQIPVADRQALIAAQEQAERDAEADHERRRSRRHRGRGAHRRDEALHGEPQNEAVPIEGTPAHTDFVPGEGTEPPTQNAEDAPAAAELVAEATPQEMAHSEDTEQRTAEPDTTESNAEIVEGDEGPLPAPEDAAAVSEAVPAESHSESNGHDEAPHPDDEAVESVGGADALEEAQERAPRVRVRQYKIQEVIKRRQVMLVQVVKEERGTKGAALTTYLSLAGR